MNEIIYAMVEYAEECRVPAYLAKDTRYKTSERESEKKIAKLQQMLTEDGRHLLEELLSALGESHGARLEAMFLAGFSLGQELSRL